MLPTPTRNVGVLRRLVVGGVALYIDRAPFLVRLYTEARHVGICGGTLLGPVTVLTAAHCVRAYNGTFYVGTYQHDVYAADDEATGSDVVRVTETRVDPRYDDADVSQGHDVAVLTLARAPRRFGAVDGPRAIALGNASFWPRVAQQPSDSAYVIGYGAATYGGPQSLHARAAHVHLYTHAECVSLLGVALAPSNLCAGLYQSDACSGDSGGPLVLAYDGALVQVGVVSWGLAAFDCGDAPGVYSLTSEAVPFLHSVNAAYVTHTPLAPDPDPCACTTDDACVSNGFSVAPRCGCDNHTGAGAPLFCYVRRDECRNATHSLFVMGALYRACTRTDALPLPRPPPSPPPSPPPLPAPSGACQTLRATYTAWGCCAQPDDNLTCVTVRDAYCASCSS